MSAKLDRIGADLEKARKKRAEWDAKVKDLERRYREEENSEIHEMVHAANLNPEQLSELLRMFAADMAPKPDTINTMNEEETQNEIEGWRLSAKLDRIGADLEKARKKRAEWDAKVKDLERRYREEENSEIHEMVHAANLNPEQLSELLRMFAADMAPKPDTINTMNEEETQNEI